MTDNRKHYCDVMAAMDARQEEGDLSDTAFWGCAFDAIEYGEFSRISNRRGWVAHNEEYGTFINYCPFCGVKLEAVND